MVAERSKLDFAYRYPFSKEAKEIVSGVGSNAIDYKYLDASKSQIEKALSNGIRYEEININSVKLDYIMTYLYSRMLISATKSAQLIRIYAMAEAKRSAEALLQADSTEIIKLARDMGLNLTKGFNGKSNSAKREELTIDFADFLKNSPFGKGFDLANQRLSGGAITLNRGVAVKLVENVISREIAKGLPINQQQLPKEVLNYAKTTRFNVVETQQTRRYSGGVGWVEKLLSTPIADVRHRTVNLILAPYLVNTKGLGVEQASKIIVDYIERCKALNPNTRITQRYIEYQCNYAKRRGLKPLSLERAKELLGLTLDTEQFFGSG